METAGAARLIADRYRLGAVIGRGGMGVVWRAHDELLSRDVAVKELVWPAAMSEGERRTACRRATMEARLAARLSHRNVIRVFDIAEEDGCPWIVLELVPHRSLRDLVADDGPLDPGRAAEVGLGILAALRAAHQQGIVHRDVKPANILIAPDRVVLTDFGIAQAAGTSTMTTVGALVGSPSYISPERAQGGESGPPGDLWGLGASLYAAVEGHGPFDRDGGALASLIAVVADEPAPPAHAGPLWPVISGLLRKNPDQRLDAVQAERMLGAVATAGPASRPGAPVRVAAARPRRSRRAAVALAGTTALAVVAVSGTALGLSASGSPQAHSAAAAAPSAAVVTPPAAVVTPPAAAVGRHRSAAAASTDPTTPARPRLAARTTSPDPRSAARPPSAAAASSGTGKADNDAAASALLAVSASQLGVHRQKGAEGAPGRHLGWLKRPHPGAK